VGVSPPVVVVEAGRPVETDLDVLEKTSEALLRLRRYIETHPFDTKRDKVLDALIRTEMMVNTQIVSDGGRPPKPT
jgi:hypothetical protein